MKPIVELYPSELREFMLSVALVRPVFIWGAPGIGKSTIVRQFSEDLGLECVPLLGSQLAPEDLIGIPKIEGNVSKFFPPSQIVRDKEFCLFIDELNIARPEIQKAFYSLILDKKVGEYELPKGSIIVGAGNRAQDSSLVKQMPSALISRLVHVHLKVSHKEWIEWAISNGVHEWVVEYIKQRPTNLWTEIPPATEEPFSTPRVWEFVSDALKSFGDPFKIPEKIFDALIFGCLTQSHATNFKSFVKQIKNRFSIVEIIKGDKDWPKDVADRDLLYFLINSFKSYLIKELPQSNDAIRKEHKDLSTNAKEALKKLSYIENEFAQMVITEDENGNKLPTWFLIDIAKELPRVMAKEKVN